MIKQIKLIGIFITAAAFCIVTVNAQTGGGFAIKEKTISSGGGVATDVTNNIFQITGSIGQPMAGPPSRNGIVGVSGGFFSGNLQPLAAGVTVSGRVLMSSEGRGLRSARVTLTDQNGVVRSMPTGSRGYYSFDEVAVGQVYIINVVSRRYSFTPQVISVTDNLTGIDFFGQ